MAMEGKRNGKEEAWKEKKRGEKTKERERAMPYALHCAQYLSTWGWGAF